MPEDSTSVAMGGTKYHAANKESAAGKNIFQHVTQESRGGGHTKKKGDATAGENNDDNTAITGGYFHHQVKQYR